MSAPATFAVIPAWTYQGKVPSIYTFFEAVALAGLEERPIRLDADTQRALLGFPVFGRRSITVHKNGAVTSSIKVCFGQDFKAATYPAALIGRAVGAKKQLRPGTTGSRYLGGVHNEPPSLSGRPSPGARQWTGCAALAARG